MGYSFPGKKDYFEYQGNTAITGSRDATREAFSNQQRRTFESY
jgi:hypothetical protein